jgi:uncharacterized damage-inducible protein DinB
MEDAFLRYSTAKLEQLTARIETCVQRLTADQIWWRGAETQNSIGNLILHLCGNVRQWIVASVGGEEDVRRRDAEFAARSGQDPDELLALLRQTVTAACTVIRSVPARRLEERVRIQDYDVTVLEAIYHVVEHFSQHTGQIMYATKLLTNDDLGFYKHLGTTGRGETVP